MSHLDEIKGSRVEEKIVTALKNRFKERLISVSIFGSVARREHSSRSDIDIFCIIEDLPSKPYKRKMVLNETISSQIELPFTILAKTEEEFLTQFPPLYLDLGLDAKIIFDRDDFLRDSLEKIREIINQAKLVRVKEGRDYLWEWQRPHSHRWQIDWEGYSEF